MGLTTTCFSAHGDSEQGDNSFSAWLPMAKLLRSQYIVLFYFKSAVGRANTLDGLEIIFNGNVAIAYLGSR